MVAEWLPSDVLSAWPVQKSTMGGSGAAKRRRTATGTGGGLFAADSASDSDEDVASDEEWSDDSDLD